MSHEEMFKNAKWVSPGSSTDTPYIRGEFSAPEASSAIITICGLGFFELYINGHRISTDLFCPVNSDFHQNDDVRCVREYGESLSHRIYCLQYDITGYIIEGRNCIGVALAPGWYTSVVRYGDVKACWNIQITGANGEITEVISEEGLKWTQSPVVECSFFFGEKQDFSSYSLEGWNRAGFDVSGWNDVKVVPSPDTEYYLQDCPADTVIRNIKPKLLKDTGEVRIYDIGENTTGYPILFCENTESTTIVIRLSERLNKEGGLEEERVHGQKSVFITDGMPRLYHTQYTWNGFRYIEVTSNAEAVDCAVIHTDVDVTSSFECDNEILNWIYEAFIRTQLSNMHSGTPSDCPHIERRGYTGDGQLVCETAMLMLDGQKFYRKWLYDISDCQDKNTGHVQYTAPYTHCGGGPGGWGCAIVEVPYVYYKTYGDREVLREFLPKMLRYFDYLEAHSEKDLVTSDQQGLWCLGDWCTAEDTEIPQPFVNNYFYIKSLNRTLEIARLLGEDRLLPGLEEKVRIRKKALIDNYYNEENGNFAGNIQGANIFAVDLGLGDERTFDNVVSHYTSLGMYDTGIFGTDILTRVLFEKGQYELAYKLLSSSGKYSFGNWMDQGATTLLEYWTGNRSHSHPMFGAVTRYLFYYVLGIRQAEDSSGYEKIVIEPYNFADLKYIKGHITTLKSKVSVRYTRVDKTVRLRIDIDEGVNAELSFKGEVSALKTGSNDFVFTV